MSFFDDDEPIRASRTRPAAPRRPAPDRTRQGGGGGGRRPPTTRSGQVDPATLRQRQLVLLGAGIVVFVILVLGVKSCRDNRRDNALKSYNRDVTRIVTDSDRIGRDFFTALDAAQSTDAPDVRVNQLRTDATGLVKEAKGLDVPSQMDRAQNDFELVLNLRAEGLRKIAAKLPNALVDGRENAATAELAVQQIAGQMQQFLASDVVYSQRVIPQISSALSDVGIKGQPIKASRFLPNLGWLTVSGVAGRLGSERVGGGQGASSTPAPGTHGHGLTSVSVGATTLTAGAGALNKLAASPAPTFKVDFQNQGENDERDVVVTVRLSGGGRQTITKKKTVAMTKAGSPASVEVPLGAKPAGGSAMITVSIQAVPGEMMTENNRQTFLALFS